jgi:hypothetical protein
MLKGLIEKYSGKRAAAPLLQSSGRCATCTMHVDFVAREPYLRDSFQCSHCGSIPRERALMSVIEEWFPHWRVLTIHESSPGYRGASKRLATLPAPRRAVSSKVCAARISRQ